MSASASHTRAAQARGQHVGPTWGVVAASGVSSVGHDLDTIYGSVRAGITRRRRTGWVGPLGERATLGLVLPLLADAGAAHLAEPERARLEAALGPARALSLAELVLTGPNGLFARGLPAGEVDLALVVDPPPSSRLLDAMPSLAPLARVLDEAVATLAPRVGELAKARGLEVRRLELYRGAVGAAEALAVAVDAPRIVLGVGRLLARPALDLYEVLGLARSALEPEAAIVGEAAAALWVEPPRGDGPRLAARVGATLEEALAAAHDACPERPSVLMADTLGDAASVAELEAGRMRALTTRGLDLDTLRPARSLCDVGGALGVMLLGLALRELEHAGEGTREAIDDRVSLAAPLVSLTQGGRALERAPARRGAAALWRAPGPSHPPR